MCIILRLPKIGILWLVSTGVVVTSFGRIQKRDQELRPPTFGWQLGPGHPGPGCLTRVPTTFSLGPPLPTRPRASPRPSAGPLDLSECGLGCENARTHLWRPPPRVVTCHVQRCRATRAPTPTARLRRAYDELCDETRLLVLLMAIARLCWRR